MGERRKQENELTRYDLFDSRPPTSLWPDRGAVFYRRPIPSNRRANTRHRTGQRGAAEIFFGENGRPASH